MDKVEAIKEEKKIKIPNYQEEFYSWLYESPNKSKLLDKQKLLNVLTLGYSSKLAKSCVEEIKSSAKVLQMGATFGEQIDVLATKVGVYGQIDLIDISKTQIDYAQEKYCYKYPFIKFVNYDASKPIKKQYDAIVCYMLLHQVPSNVQAKIISNALNCLKPQGKAIFIDYHKPKKWHPLAWIAKQFNRLYQPFAEEMWQKNIATFVQKAPNFYCKKELFFGGFYQKTTIVRKKD